MKSSGRAHTAFPPAVSIHSVGWHLAWFGLSAVLLALAFPQPGWGWLAHAALVPAALLAVGSTDTKRLLWTSYLVAVAWWLVRLSWLIHVTAGGYVMLSLYLALYTPMAWWAVRLLYRRNRISMFLALPMVWVSLEITRAYFPAGGFNWFTLGHTQAPFSDTHAPGRLIQIADLFGEHAVSLVVAMTNGLIVDLILMLRVSGRHGRSLPYPTIRAACISWLIVMLGAHAYGYFRIHQTDPATPAGGLRVAVVQTNVPQDNKNHPTPEKMHADWQRMLDLTRQAGGQSPAPQLIVWPETMVPAGLNAAPLESDQSIGITTNQSFHEQIQHLARSLDTHLIVGAHAYFDWKIIPLPDNQSYYRIPGKRYNSAYLYRPDGSQASQRYDKVHRVPFGEYIPWVESFPWLKQQFIKYLSPYEVDYTLQPGKQWTVFAISAEAAPNQTGQALSNDHPATPTVARIATPICFEDAIARVTRPMVYRPDGSKQTDLLVNLTNDGWYAGTHQGPQHMQIAVFRCIETRTPMARSVNGGISGFIDSMGRIGPVVKEHGHTQEVEGFATHTVRFDQRTTWFSKFGAMPAVGLSCLTLVLVGIGWLRG